MLTKNIINKPLILFIILNQKNLRLSTSKLKQTV